MVVLSEQGRDLILHSTDYKPCAIGSRFTMHFVGAMMTGLAAPIFVFALIDPKVLAHGPFMLTLIMICAMLACTFMFACSVVSPGPVKAVTFDRDNRSMTVERQGCFASTNREVAFDQVATMQMINGYDDDGYGSSATPMVVLRSREGLLLPTGTDETHLQTLRAILGFK